jgi:hypothetical protein
VDSDRQSFPLPSVEQNAEYAFEASTLVEIDGIVRATKRVEALEQRLRALGRVGRRLAPR